MTRSVWRKRLKRIGLVLSILMLAFWVFSVLFVFFYVPPNSQWTILLSSGRISFTGPQQSIPGWRCVPYYSILKQIAAVTRWTEFANKWLGFGLPGKIASGLYVPVWLLVVATGFPTAILWWRDRRPKAGFCKVCKYDLTGNESGTCPECGEAVE